MQGNAIPIIKCVPNFSEGKRAEVIQELIKSIESVPQTKVLDASMNADHNRSVITFLASPSGLKAAIPAMVSCAIAMIDMTCHAGVHPRIGAVDVLPLVPLENITLAECADLCHAIGEDIAFRYQIPVFFYEAAAVIPERRNLANFRKRLESIRTEMESGRLRPDVGPPHMHPTAGAIAMGARGPLIAFNVNLDCSDLSIARAIARSIRERDGGLRAVKALGLELKSRGIAQVSVNLVNPDVTSLSKVFDRICFEAEAFGTRVLESEIIGTIPASVAAELVGHYLRIPDFSVQQIDDARVESFKNMLCLKAYQAVEEEADSVRKDLPE